jgi:hypothetical protein
MTMNRRAGQVLLPHLSDVIQSEIFFIAPVFSPGFTELWRRPEPACFPKPPGYTRRICSRALCCFNETLGRDQIVNDQDSVRSKQVLHLSQCRLKRNMMQRRNRHDAVVTVIGKGSAHKIIDQVLNVLLVRGSRSGNTYHLRRKVDSPAPQPISKAFSECWGR